MARILIILVWGERTQRLFARTSQISPNLIIYEHVSYFNVRHFMSFEMLKAQPHQTFRSSLIINTSKGLYCPAGDFYIDPSRPVEKAVITHAHGDHARSGSTYYFAAKPSLPLLEERIGTEADISAIPYGESFVMNDALVSFHSAGHILGSAQIRIEVDDEVWVVSGDYKRSTDPSCEPFEVVPCDTFITECTFGLPIYRWDEGHQTVGDIFDWWSNNRETGQTSLLFCYALGKAQRVLAELAKLTDRDVYLHGAMEHLTEIYRQSGIHLVPTRLVSEMDKKYNFAGDLVLAPPSAFRSSWMKRFKDIETGFASGWMRIRGNRRRNGYDRGFVMSDHADWEQLLRTIRETGAKRILAMHGSTHTLVRYLQEQGYDADSLQTFYQRNDRA